MLGNNPIRAIVKNDGQNLSVQDIFLTIQGEGPLAGVPAVFLRLGGCNLACKFCDTEFENFYDLSINDILNKITQLIDNTATNLIVITGGEPMRQPIENLCNTLLARNFNIQIETNGTIFRNLPKEISIVCSPKSTMLGYHKIRPDLLQRVNAIKFIISKNIYAYSTIPEVGQSEYNIPVYLQPMDEQDPKLNAENIDYTIQLVQKHNHRLSIQIHKLIGIP